jgi:hypothetical protein
MLMMQPATRSYPRKFNAIVHCCRYCNFSAVHHFPLQPGRRARLQGRVCKLRPAGVHGGHGVGPPRVLSSLFWWCTRLVCPQCGWDVVLVLQSSSVVIKARAFHEEMPRACLGCCAPRALCQRPVVVRSLVPSRWCAHGPTPQYVECRAVVVVESSNPRGASLGARRFHIDVVDCLEVMPAALDASQYVRLCVHVFLYFAASAILLNSASALNRACKRSTWRPQRPPRLGTAGAGASVCCSFKFV